MLLSLHHAALTGLGWAALAPGSGMAMAAGLARSAPGIERLQREILCIGRLSLSWNRIEVVGPREGDH